MHFASDALSTATRLRAGERSKFGVATGPVTDVANGRSRRGLRRESPLVPRSPAAHRVAAPQVVQPAGSGVAAGRVPANHEIAASARTVRREMVSGRADQASVATPRPGNPDGQECRASLTTGRLHSAETVEACRVHEVSGQPSRVRCGGAGEGVKVPSRPPRGVAEAPPPEIDLDNAIAAESKTLSVLR